MRAVLIILIATTAFANLGCDAIFDNGCPEDTERWIEYQLFMGLSAPDGAVVDDTEWETFLADTVTPRFPDGLTVLDGDGQWRGSDGRIQKEASKLLIILAPNDDDEAEELIDQISNEYKSRFEQESVLKTISKICVTF